MKLVPKHSILFILIISCTSITGQTILIKQTVPENFEDIDEGHGPNRAHFSYPYFALGMHTDGYSHENDTTISPVYGKSMEMRFGTRTRLKLNRFLGFGIDYELGYSAHFINLKDAYALANFSPDVKKVRYQIYTIGAASYFQFNFEPKRGNQLGSYLDIGVFGSYNFGRKYSQTLKIGKEKSVYKLKKLQDFEKLNYGAIFRFGKRVWAIYAKYRYSNSFKNKTTTGNYELPRLTFGFEYFFGKI